MEGGGQKEREREREKERWGLGGRNYLTHSILLQLLQLRIVLLFLRDGLHQGRDSGRAARSGHLRRGSALHRRPRRRGALRSPGSGGLAFRRRGASAGRRPRTRARRSDARFGAATGNRSRSIRSLHCSGIVLAPREGSPSTGGAAEVDSLVAFLLNLVPPPRLVFARGRERRRKEVGKSVSSARAQRRKSTRRGREGGGGFRMQQSTNSIGMVEHPDRHQQGTCADTRDLRILIRRGPIG